MKMNKGHEVIGLPKHLQLTNNNVTELSANKKWLLCRVRLRREDFLVHVKAQVMSRDDNKGGWVPRGAGGMSIISLCRLPPRSSNPADVSSRELLIYGRRIADKSVTCN